MEYPHRQRDGDKEQPALEYYERVARLADADAEYQAYLCEENGHGH